MTSTLMKFGSSLLKPVKKENLRDFTKTTRTTKTTKTTKATKTTKTTKANKTRKTTKTTRRHNVSSLGRGRSGGW